VNYEFSPEIFKAKFQPRSTLHMSDMFVYLENIQMGFNSGQAADVCLLYVGNSLVY